MRLTQLLVATALVAIPVVSSAQQGDLTHNQPAVPDAAVDFGVLPFPATTPLGPPPCLQTGGIGGPADPCAYHLHHLVPEEVTIRKGGEVTFQVHSGGHAPAIYQVSKNTTREGIGQFLKTGRYLVICMNRTHFLNDWMFGFVNVTGQ